MAGKLLMNCVRNYNRVAYSQVSDLCVGYSDFNERWLNGPYW